MLLVEDSATQALRTRMGLESQGFTVVVASESPAALELARRERPDVVLSDVRMPEVDGFELCRSFAADPLLGSTPFVLHSATFHTGEDRELALALGARSYVKKQLEPEELASTLHTAMADSPGPDEAGTGIIDEASFLGRHRARLLHHLVAEEGELERTTAALAAAYDLTLQALVGALDMRDTETEHHSWRVNEYSLTLGRRLGLDDAALTDLERGALLHDIGKIGIPDHILRKPGKLTEEEWVEMRKHPQLGYEMLAGIQFLKCSAEIVLSHHERWDGTGYPRGLSGSDIPLGSRIFAVADTLDAITSNRPYRAAQPFEVGLEELGKMRGSQFDPQVVDAALEISPGGWQEIKQRVQSIRDRNKLRRDP